MHHKQTHIDYRKCHFVFSVRATRTECNMALVVARQGWGILSLRWALSETNEWRLLSWNHTWTTGKNVRSGNEEGGLAWADFSKHVLFSQGWRNTVHVYMLGATKGVTQTDTNHTKTPTSAGHTKAKPTSALIIPTRDKTTLLTFPAHISD